MSAAARSGLCAQRLAQAPGDRDAVAEHGLDAHLEADLRDALDERLQRAVLLILEHVDVVRAHPCPAEPRDRADEAHDERAGRATGEIANGRSTIADTSVLPRQRPRTSASARPTPKTVFSGTAIATIMQVSQNACWASGVVTASKAAPTPCSNVRKKTIATGIASSAAR